MSMQEIKIKMEEVIGANMALMNLANVKMPIDISVGLSDLISSLESKVAIYGKEEKKLMDLYCEKNESGELVLADPDNPRAGYKIADREAYSKGITELNETEVSIMYEPINLGTLEIEFGIVKMLRKFMIEKIKE